MERTINKIFYYWRVSIIHISVNIHPKYCLTNNNKKSIRIMYFRHPASAYFLKPSFFNCGRLNLKWYLIECFLKIINFPFKEIEPWMKTKCVPIHISCFAIRYTSFYKRPALHQQYMYNTIQPKTYILIIEPGENRQNTGWINRLNIG